MQLFFCPIHTHNILLMMVVMYDVFTESIYNRHVNSTAKRTERLNSESKW
jgi:hypothetical protein